MVSPDLPPEPERESKVAVHERNPGSRDEGITGAVQCTRAACELAGLGPATALERPQRAAPVARRRPLDGEHLAQVRPAAPAAWTLDAGGPARRAAFKPAGHRRPAGGGSKVWTLLEVEEDLVEVLPDGGSVLGPPFLQRTVQILDQIDQLLPILGRSGVRPSAR